MGKAIKIILASVAIIALFTLVFGTLRVFTAGVNAPVEIIEKTIDADNIIYNYEWFKQQNEDFTALKNKIAIAIQAENQFKNDAGPRKDWTFEDKTEAARLNSIVIGLNNQLEDLVANYNARSKMANRNIFKDGELPSQLSTY